MVLGEGSVFAFLLILGLHRIVRSMRRERERLARERNMLLGVTHELKTPLASVQLGVDTLRRMTLSESDRVTVLENMQSGLRDLERRVEDMLVATRLQKPTPVQVTRFSWQGMAEEAVERCSTAGSSRVMLERESEAEFEVRGDQGLWTLAAANVVENALKYSDGPVQVRAFSEGSTAVLEVEDEGPGIAPKDWEAAKSPFVRLQEGGAGTGLGLHLVAQTAELHGGRIEMQRGKPSGFVVRLVWPSAK